MFNRCVCVGMAVFCAVILSVSVSVYMNVCIMCITNAMSEKFNLYLYAYNSQVYVYMYVCMYVCMYVYACVLVCTLFVCVCVRVRERVHRVVCCHLPLGFVCLYLNDT